MLTRKELKALESRPVEELTHKELVELYLATKVKKDKLVERSRITGLTFDRKPETVIHGEVVKDEDSGEMLGEILGESPTTLTHLPFLRKRTEKCFPAPIIEGKEAPTHTLIKGDNYPALIALLPEYRGKVDVIYIDPPYNTGNKDFIYDDSYVDKEDSFRHSLWLSFMERRLKLAEELLSDSGVIFVSIDDNEQAYLKVLMDEIFEERNFVANLIWKSGSATGQDSRHFAVQTEYVLVYSKSGNYKTNALEKDTSVYKLEDEYVKTRGKYRLNQLDRGSLDYTASLDYPIHLDGKVFYAGGVSGEESEKRRENKKPRKDWRYRWNAEKVKWGIENGFIVSKGNKVFYKDYELVDNNDNPVNKTITPTNLITDFKTAQGSSEIQNILGKNKFSYPKPTSLIKWLLDRHPNKAAIVLDFFAGSGTTGHAVAELNKEDGGTRQAILITDSGKVKDSENKEEHVDIAEEITYERMRRVLTGKDWDKPEKAVNLEQGLDFYDVKWLKAVSKRHKDAFGNPAPVSESSVTSRLAEELEVSDDLLDEDGQKLSAMYKNWISYRESFFEEERKRTV